MGESREMYRDSGPEVGHRDRMNQGDERTQTDQAEEILGKVSWKALPGYEKLAFSN